MTFSNFFHSQLKPLLRKLRIEAWNPLRVPKESVDLCTLTETTENRPRLQLILFQATYTNKSYSSLYRTKTYIHDFRSLKIGYTDYLSDSCHYFMVFLIFNYTFRIRLAIKLFTIYNWITFKIDYLLIISSYSQHPNLKHGRKYTWSEDCKNRYLS